MAPITRAKAAPSSPLVRRAVGAPVLLLAGVVMVPWLAANAAVAGVALGIRGLARAPRAAVAMLDYAGEIALGR